MLLALLAMGLTIATPEGARLSACAPENQFEAARCLDRHLGWLRRGKIFDVEFLFDEDMTAETDLIQQVWFDSPSGELAGELASLGYPAEEWSRVTLESYWLYSHGCSLDLEARAESDAERREIHHAVTANEAAGPYGAQQQADGSWVINDPPTYGRTIYRPRCPYLRETR